MGTKRVEQVEPDKHGAAGSVVVPLDGSPLAEHALPCATALARATGRRVLLVRAVCPSPAQDEPDAMRQARAEMAGLAGRLEQERLTVETRVGRCAPARLIAGAAAEEAGSVVVMSTHGGSGFGRWLYGGITDEVLRRTPVPVLLVPATCEHPWAAGRPVRLLVPLDGSDAALEVLPAVANLVQELAAEVVLARVVEPPVPREYRYGQGQPYVDFYPHVELADARTYLARIGAVLPATVHLGQPVVELGLPALVLGKIAREQRADMVAMTTCGYGRTHGHEAGAAVGQTAMATLQAAGVPLLLVRPVGRVSTGTRPTRDAEEDAPRRDLVLV